MSIPASPETPSPGDLGTDIPEFSEYVGLVTLEEFNNKLGNPTWNPRVRDRMATLLRATQQQLENYLNRPVEPVQVREYLKADANGYLNTSITPVLKVIGVTPFRQMGQVIVNNEPEYTPGVLVRDDLIGGNGRVIDKFTPAAGDPMITPGGIYLGYSNYALVGIDQTYAVEYVGGLNGAEEYSTTGHGLKESIMDVAARSVDGSRGVTLNLRQGNAETASQSDEREQGWTADELILWDRLRRRVIV